MKFKVIVDCQGQRFEYKYKNLFSALCGYAYHYIKKNKYGTMKFTLKQIPSSEQWGLGFDFCIIDDCGEHKEEMEQKNENEKCN